MGTASKKLGNWPHRVDHFYGTLVLRARCRICSAVVGCTDPLVVVVVMR